MALSFPAASDEHLNSSLIIIQNNYTYYYIYYIRVSLYTHYKYTHTWTHIKSEYTRIVFIETCQREEAAMFYGTLMHVLLLKYEFDAGRLLLRVFSRCVIS